MSNYPDNWKEIAKAVKDAAEWRCIRCDRAHNPSAGYCLTVHHWDMDKANCRWWNLLALCQRCHLHIQAVSHPDTPWMFEHSEWLKIYAAGFYAHKYLGKGVRREWVESRLDELLALERIA